MRVALLADIHANAAALAATLSEAKKEGAERLVLLGDYVGYFFEPARTLEMLLSWPCDAIRGNHDRALLQGAADPAALCRYRRHYGPSLDVALEELPGEVMHWLESLPETLTIQLGGHRAMLCHGSPQDPDEYVYWNSGAERLQRLSKVEADIVLMGHTHHPFVRPGKPWLLNPGSVGQARDVGGFASWCLVDVDQFTFSFRRTPYDVASVMDQLMQHMPAPGRQHAILTRNNPALAALGPTGTFDAL